MELSAAQQLTDSEVAIRVEGLWKEYILGSVERRNTTFREMLTDAATAPFRKLKRLGGAAAEEERFWALRDVTFEIPRGQVVGVIGRNGAGKSTLLKILSRITAPTRGRVEMRGRVASLLEVGTGFHPELTGRENIFLNGAILGMSQREIQARFDEIVAFAEIEKFLDTPVKRYSSGMYVRLAFSVAAHLEPEILLVDEVLAVGDVDFQRKCLGKMESVAGAGRTVVFVSHNLPMIQSLCNVGMLLRAGEIVAAGTVQVVTDIYLKTSDRVTERLSWTAGPSTAESPRFCGISIYQGQNPSMSSNLVGGVFTTLSFEVRHFTRACSCIFTIYDNLDQPVALFDTANSAPSDHVDISGSGRLFCSFESLLLAPGRYHLNAAIRSGGQIIERVESPLEFSIAPGIVEGRPTAEMAQHGRICHPHVWRAEQITPASGMR